MWVYKQTFKEVKMERLVFNEKNNQYDVDVRNQLMKDIDEWISGSSEVSYQIDESILEWKWGELETSKKSHWGSGLPVVTLQLKDKFRSVSTEIKHFILERILDEISPYERYDKFSIDNGTSGDWSLINKIRFIGKEKEVN